MAGFFCIHMFRMWSEMFREKVLPLSETDLVYCLADRNVYGKKKASVTRLYKFYRLSL